MTYMGDPKGSSKYYHSKITAYLDQEGQEHEMKVGPSRELIFHPIFLSHRSRWHSLIPLSGGLVGLNIKLYSQHAPRRSRKGSNCPHSPWCLWKQVGSFHSFPGGTLISPVDSVSKPSRELTFHPLPDGSKQW